MSPQKKVLGTPQNKKTKEKNTQKSKMEANQAVLLPGYIVYTLEFRNSRQITEQFTCRSFLLSYLLAITEDTMGEPVGDLPFTMVRVNQQPLVHNSGWMMCG
jgi:hypothetical protein